MLLSSADKCLYFTKLMPSMLQVLKHLFTIMMVIKNSNITLALPIDLAKTVTKQILLIFASVAFVYLVIPYTIIIGYSAIKVQTKRLTAHMLNHSFLCDLTREFVSIPKYTNAREQL